MGQSWLKEGIGAELKLWEGSGEEIVEGGKREISSQEGGKGVWQIRFGKGEQGTVWL